MTRRAGERGGERGFTLIEVMVAITVMMLLVPPLAGTITGVIKSSASVEEGLDRNNDAQRIAAAWTRDVQSVDFAGVTQAGDSGGTPCALDQGSVHLVSFRSSDLVATWAAVGAGPAISLVRKTCSQGSVIEERTLANRLGTTGSTAAGVVHGPTAGQPGVFCPQTVTNGVKVGRSCSIVIDGRWTYDLTVARRALDTAAATPPDTCSNVPGNIVKNCNFETVNPWQGNQLKPHNWACQSNTHMTDLTIWPNDFCGANPGFGLNGTGNGYVASGNFNFRYVRYEISQGCHEKGDGRQCRGGTANDLFLDRTKNYRLRANIVKGHSLDNGVWSDFDVEIGVRKYYGGTNSDEFVLNIDNAISRVTTPLGAGDNATYRTYEAFVSTADLAKIAGTGPVQVEIFARVFPKNYTNSSFWIDDVSLAPVASVPPDAGVLANGGFENGAGSWNLCATKCGVDTNPTFPTPYSRTGLRNGFINTGSTTSGWFNLTQSVAVAPNSTYRLTGWIRTSANNNAGYFGVRTGSGQIVKEQQFGRNDAYVRVTMDLNTGANSSLVVYGGTWANGANTWFQLDDASLVKL